MSVEAGQSDELGLQLAAIAPQYGFCPSLPRWEEQHHGCEF